MSLQPKTCDFSLYKKPQFEQALELALHPTGESRVLLIPIGRWVLLNEVVIQDFAQWRTTNREMFFSRFPHSTPGMKRYLQDLSIARPNRVLFLMVSSDLRPIGHLGLVARSQTLAEVDAIMLAPGMVQKGIMFNCLKELMKWGTDTFGFIEYSLQVLSNNARAIRLYERLGFEETLRLPLRMHVEDEIETLRICAIEDRNTSLEHVTMHLKTEQLSPL